MRWQCTACQVEWTTTGKDHGPCWNGSEVGLDCSDHIRDVIDVPAWRWGYRDVPDTDRSEAWREPHRFQDPLIMWDELAPMPDWDALREIFG